MWYGSADDPVRRLEDDLYSARRAILSLLPPKVQEVAESYYYIESRAEAHDWLDRVVQVTVDVAWPLAEEQPYSGRRAYCPLCHRGSQGPSVEGFLVPGGLRKHLLGEGNAHPCPVLKHIRELAEHYWLPRVRETEAKEKAAADAEKERRHATEDQFRTSPRGAPQLRDEDLWGYASRDDDSLRWAIARLLDLGFTEASDGGVVQFTKDYGEMVVYADPRRSGRLEFEIYRRKQVDQPNSRRRWTPDHGSFHLLDSWRNNLKAKFEQRVEAARLPLRQKAKR